MTLLEAAKAVVRRWDDPRHKFDALTVTVIDALRTAIAAEEANPFGYCSDGKPWADHAVHERVRRVTAEKERDELRAKLAALESAEPVAWLFSGRCEKPGRLTSVSFASVDPNDLEQFDLKDRKVTPLYIHPAPAYTPMTEQELWGFVPAAATPVDLGRAIEQAVLRRLGVGS